LKKYKRLIRDRVGHRPPAGPEIKGLKPEPPRKYDGKNDIELFDQWLLELLNYMRIYKMCGNAHDSLRVDIAGQFLEKQALDWYTQEVTMPFRIVFAWTFQELICAIYVRFIHEATAQNAADKFEQVKYSHSKGVLAFYNDLQKFAVRMVQPPDEYSVRRRFLSEIDPKIRETMLVSRGISAEHSSMNAILDYAREVEAAIQQNQRYERKKS